jgi:hypothetical protein
MDDDEAFSVGRLIQWGLQVKARPATEPEYQTLIDRYLDQTSFRHCTQQVARGLGLMILDVGAFGLVLGPMTDSVFALAGGAFHPTASTDDRLLDGLVQVAIAATVFPTARDLQDDPTVVRPPVTVDEVDDTLRRLCDDLAERSRQQCDPAAVDETAGLTEAWRVYQRRLNAHDTTSQRQSPRSMRRIIERNLDRLRDLGCFLRQGNEQATWQPTHRYQIHVCELAATQLYQAVQKSLANVRPDAFKELD